MIMDLFHTVFVLPSVTLLWVPLCVQRQQSYALSADDRMTLEYMKKLFEKDYVEPYDVLLYNYDVFIVPFWGK